MSNEQGEIKQATPEQTEEEGNAMVPLYWFGGAILLVIVLAVIGNLT